ncbi:mobilisation protein (MobC) [Ruminococcaceae bacterium FB2012]|nr:mobilisation protein (MobC) [Ruminococcaceae bacterium FB2012]
MIQIRKRNKTIAIRCTEDEYNRMHRRAAEHGLKLSDFVLRTALGKKIIIAEGLQDVVRQQRAIGNNLNQLTRLANQGEINIIDLRKLVGEYKAVTEMISEVLREVK